MSTPGKELRLTRTRRIGELFDHGVRAGDGRATLLGLPNELDLTRMAFAVGKRQHGNAVRRNRMRRLCREAFRSVHDALPAGWDLVMMPRGRADHSVENLAASIAALTSRLVAKQRGNRDAGVE